MSYPNVEMDLNSGHDRRVVENLIEDMENALNGAL